MFHPNGEIVTGPPPAATVPFAEVFEQPPPRRLPPVVARRIRRKSRGLAFFFLLFGGIFLLVGLPVSLIFFPWHIKDSLALSAGPAATARGAIATVEDTTYKLNNGRVHRFFYTFEVDGRERQGRCYFAGGNYAEGCPVQVRYLVSRPELNCVVGGTFDPAGNSILFVVIFPLIGLGVFGYGVWGATVGVWRNLELARDGFVAEGRVTDVVATDVRVNHRRRYEIFVDFDALGPRQMSYYAYGPDVDQARHWKESGAVLHVLYDRQRPKRALVLDHILG